MSFQVTLAPHPFTLSKTWTATLGKFGVKNGATYDHFLIKTGTKKEGGRIVAQFDEVPADQKLAEQLLKSAKNKGYDLSIRVLQDAEPEPEPDDDEEEGDPEE